MSQIANSSGRNLVWLASYPKSGNTWLRAMLTAALFPDEPLDLDDLAGDISHGLRQELDDLAGTETALMSAERLIPYQAMLYRDIASQVERPYFCKTHSGWWRDSYGVALFPEDACAGAVLMVRNPVDVVPSYAHHEDKSRDQIIAMMADREMTLNHWKGRNSVNLPQRMSSWSEHTRSWIDECDFPLLVLRYEDVLADPHVALGKVLEFCRIPVSVPQIDAAVAAASFDALKSREQSAGFAEKPRQSRRFFREGKAGEGARKLTGEQIARLVEDHCEIMARLGYGNHPAENSEDD